MPDIKKKAEVNKLTTPGKVTEYKRQSKHYVIFTFDITNYV